MKILIAIYFVIVNMAFDMSVLSKFGSSATQQEIVSYSVSYGVHIKDRIIWSTRQTDN